MLRTRRVKNVRKNRLLKRKNIIRKNTRKGGYKRKTNKRRMKGGTAGQIMERRFQRTGKLPLNSLNYYKGEEPHTNTRTPWGPHAVNENGSVLLPYANSATFFKKPAKKKWRSLKLRMPSWWKKPSTKKTMRRQTGRPQLTNSSPISSPLSLSANLTTPSDNSSNNNVHTNSASPSETHLTLDETRQLMKDTPRHSNIFGTTDL